MKIQSKIYLIGMLLVSTASFAQQTTTAPQAAVSVREGAQPPLGGAYGGSSNMGKESGLTKALNTVMGGALIAKGTTDIASSGCPSTPCGWGQFFLGILEIAQGTQNFAQSGENNRTGNIAGMSQCSFGSSYCSGSTWGQTTNPENWQQSLTPEAIGQLDATAADLKSRGVDFDWRKGKITTPDGKTFSSNDLSSKAAAMKAGIPGGSWDSAMATSAAIEAAAMEKLKDKFGKDLGLESGGVASGTPSGSSMEDESELNGRGSGAYDPNAAKNKRKPASAAGLSKMYNGSPIGVAADSIFDMISRRYVKKDKEDKAFITEAESAMLKH